MDVTQIRQTINDNITDSVLTLTDAPFSAPATVSLFTDILENGELVVRNAVTTDITDGIQVEGLCTVRPFIDMHVSAQFIVINSQAEVLLEATTIFSWTLAESFSVLAESLLAEVAMGDQQKLSYNSYEVSPTQLQGLWFDGSLALKGSLTMFAWLFDAATALPLTGQIQMVDGLPQMELNAPVGVAIPIGFLQNIAFECALLTDVVSNPGQNSYVMSRLRFSADIPFNAQSTTHHLTVSTSYYGYGGMLVFQVTLTEVVSAALIELEALLDNSSIGALFPSSLQLENVLEMKDLVLIIDPFHKTLSSVGVGIGSVHTWTVIPNLLAIDQVTLYATLSNPTQNSQLNLMLFGDITIGQYVTLNVSASYPDFTFQGKTEDEFTMSLQQLGEYFLGTMPHVPAVNIELLEVYAHPEAGEYQVNGDVELGWTINPTASTSIVIESLHFEVGKVGAQGATGLLSGVLSIGDVDLFLAAEHASAASGWQFTGNTGEDQEIPIGTLIADISAIFGVVTLPAAIEELTLSDISVAFNTQTKDFAFTLHAAFPVGDADEEVQIAVALDLTHDAGSYTFEFSGHITVGSLQFDLVFDSTSGATRLVAAYHNVSGDVFNIHDLMAGVSSAVAAYIPPSLQITLNDALFAYAKVGVDKTFAFGLDLGASFSLSELPLIGRKFPKDKTIGVEDLHVLIVSKPLAQAEGSALNALIPQGVTPLPSGDIDKGFHVSANIDFGIERAPLSLPVAGGSPPNGGGGPSGPITHAADDNIKWFSVQKNFGPVHFERIGVQYGAAQNGQEERLTFYIDASFSMAGLTLVMDRLTVGSPLSAFHPKFDIRGIGVAFEGGPIEIGGAFLREKILVNGEEINEYSGGASIKTPDMAITAVGSYATLNGQPSLFIYSALNYPIGGPPFFFVLGLAAGFGFNRRLNIPPVAELINFPLVDEAITGTGNIEDLEGELQKLHTYITPALTEYFLAIGIKFSTYGMVDSFALLTMSFGTRFEMDILGISTAIIPTPEEGKDVTPLAEAQLAFKASFIPDEGALIVTAQLTSNSFIFSRDCHLTGGYAFGVWFAGAHTGDFIKTLGGYHPEYNVPAHYPSVPRLGFNWRYNDNITIKGDCYYALTSHALMAGGHLEATWHSGSLEAWFKAGADYLIAWKPYHYDAHIFVSFGVKYTFHFFGTHHISAHVSADIHIWGPEFSGTAHVHLWIVSFTVSFGADASQTPQPIAWNIFRDSFLPAGDSVCTVALQDGLARKVSDAGQDVLIVNPKHVALRTDSMIPVKQVVTGVVDITSQVMSAGQTDFGVGSMAVAHDDLATTQTITIVHDGIDNVEDDFEFQPVYKKAPAGLWGDELTPEVNGPEYIENAVAGFVITPKETPSPGETHAIDRVNLQFSTDAVSQAYDWTTLTPFTPNGQDESQRRATIKNDIVESATVTARNQLLADLGVSAPIDLSDTAADDFLIAPLVQA